MIPEETWPKNHRGTLSPLFAYTEGLMIWNDKNMLDKKVKILKKKPKKTQMY